MLPKYGRTSRATTAFLFPLCPKPIPVYNKYMALFSLVNVLEYSLLANTDPKANPSRTLLIRLVGDSFLILDYIVVREMDGTVLWVLQPRSCP